MWQAGYTILTAEELREPAQYVTDKIRLFADSEEDKVTEMTHIQSLILGLSKERKLEILSCLMR